MNITKDTKLKDIMEMYPHLKERLTDISPKFKMLNSPIGKAMLGKVTVSDMSEKSGMDIENLINAFRKITEQE